MFRVLPVSLTLNNPSLSRFRYLLPGGSQVVVPCVLLLVQRWTENQQSLLREKPLNQMEEKVLVWQLEPLGSDPYLWWSLAVFARYFWWWSWGVTGKAWEESRSSEWPLGVSLLHGRYNGPQARSSPSIFPAPLTATWDSATGERGF